MFDVKMGLPLGLPGNPYALHEHIYAMLADEEGGREGFQYTTDWLTDGQPLVIVRTDRVPESWRHHITEEVRQPQEGEAYAFRLRASPSKKQGGKHRPFAADDREGRLRWLKRKGELHGFEVIHARVDHAPEWLMRRRKRFWVDDTIFVGSLVVTDADKFNETLRSGIGRKRAFGRGLLQVQRIDWHGGRK